MICYWIWNTGWIILRSTISSRWFSLQGELSFPRQAVRILSVAGALLLLPGARFLMDSRNLSGFSMQVLTEQFRHERLITQALLQHWFLGKVFYYFMAVSLDTVALIFSWGNIMKFLWKKYAFPHNHVIIIFFFSCNFSKDWHFYFLDKLLKIPIPV